MSIDKYDIEKIVKIQKIIRGYQLRKNILIPHSYYQTKKWRKNRKWYINGKHNECEKYQINLIEKIINSSLTKTYERINIETNKIIKNKNPLTKDDGFEWTENFDGKIDIGGKLFYFNLKFVCDDGGSQIRTLREVYQFIKCQTKIEKKEIYFMNILDGDTSYKYINKFKYLKNKKNNTNIFIGDLYDFQNYWKKFSNICSVI
jgi:hypothetical protein